MTQDARPLNAPSNTHELLLQLAGRAIKGVFTHESSLILVFEDGEALALSSFGGDSGPVYWAEKDWKRKLDSHARRMRELTGETARLLAIEAEELAR
jgi:hypothetical protein